MKKNFYLALLCLFTTLMFSSSFSQSNCSMAGWATQNGGTTGGGTAAPITVSTITDLQTQANSTGSKVIYVSGNLGSGVSTRVIVAANKTIIGLPGATLYGGFDIKSSNVIIRNMKVRGPGSVDVNGVDCIAIQGASNVWIDHCEIYDGQDGNLDITNNANYITVSWTKFYYTSASSNHMFCNLIGSSDSRTTDRGKLKVTFMNNWWGAGVKERMPRVRFGQVHVVNNYFNSTSNSHCVRAGVEANLLIEGNYFEGVKTPVDLYENNFTAVTVRNNTFISTSGNTLGSGTAFTPPYSLTVLPSVDVKALVTSATCGAGATMSSPTDCCGTVTTSYTLTTNNTPSGAGTVSKNPNVASYAPGTAVTLTATPATGYTFTGWSGDATGTASSVTITMDGNKSVTANYQANTVTTYTLTTTATPTTGGTVTRSPNAASYSAGTVVSLTATPATGYTFTGWSGDVTGTATTVSVTMDANKSVIANFQANTVTTYTLTTTATPTAGGTITRSPNAASYSAGTIVSLTATPATGYTFTGWSGDATGTATTVSLTMNANRSVTANFQATSTGTATIRIEDNATPSTGLCSYEGTISSNSGASNSKVINLTNSVAKGINWSINSAAGGSYAFNWRYVNSSSSNTYSMKLIVNGITINSALPFPKTSSSTTFSNTTTTLALVAGNNTIRLESTASNATADIDWLEVTGVSPAAGNCTSTGRLAAPIVSLTEDDVNTSLQVYPNPAKGDVTISFYSLAKEKVQAILYGANGMKTQAVNLQAIAGFNRHTITLKGKTKGFYSLVVIHGSGAREIKTIVIE